MKFKIIYHEYGDKLVEYVNANNVIDAEIIFYLRHPDADIFIIQREDK